MYYKDHFLFYSLSECNQQEELLGDLKLTMFLYNALQSSFVLKQ